MLRHYYEAGIAEIAETLGISQNSVKTHLKRGMAALEIRLGTMDAEPEAVTPMSMLEQRLHDALVGGVAAVAREPRPVRPRRARASRTTAAAAGSACRAAGVAACLLGALVAVLFATDRRQ